MTDDTTQERMAWLQALMEKNGRQFGAYAATANAIEAIMQKGAEQERAKVVALLREMAINFPKGKQHNLSAIAITCAADGIERGDHLGTSK
jgi:hypothetical protein